MTYTKVEFTPETLPGGNPIEVMKEFLGREVIRLDIHLPEGAAGIDYRLGLHMSEGTKWGYWTQTAATHERTNRLREDGNDDVVLAMVDGPILMRARGVDDFLVKRGELLLFSQARNWEYSLPSTSAGWTMSLPHKTLKALLPSLEEAPLKTIRKRTPGLLLLRSYLQATALERFEQPDTCAMAARHLHDLIALTLRGMEKQIPEALEGTVSSTRRKTIEADMLAHLDQPDLDLEWIAARQGVSTRHVQRLFASQDTSFSDELRRMRLEKAAAILSDERSSHRTIMSIAMDTGFVDAPTFNRSFKRHFGFTPRELRPRR